MNLKEKLQSKLQEYEKEKLQSNKPIVEIQTGKCTRMPKVYGYVRVSTQKQVREGHSVEAQTQNIKDYCKKNGLNINDDDIYSDNGISGKDSDTRINFSILKKIVSKGDTIISYSMSRFGRDTEQMISFINDMKKRGVGIVCLDNSSLDYNSVEGRLLITISAGLNCFEREKISERTSNTMQYMKREGKLITKPPFGYYSKGNKLVENESEQLVIEFIVKLLYDYPEISIYKITSELQKQVDLGNLKMRTSKGLKRPNSGNKVYHSTIGKIVKGNKLKEIVNEMKKNKI